MSSTFILQIETATPMCSVAISKNGETIALKEAHEPNIHAAQLTLFIQQLMLETDLTFQELSAIAVSKGPGSYTGLRIGVATAKGICFASEIPLLMTDTLHAMALGFSTAQGEMIGANTLLHPMIDARRMEVYTAAFNEDLTIADNISAKIIDANSFDDKTGNQQMILFGSGADKFSSLFESNPQVHISLGFQTSADFHSGLAYQGFLSAAFVDLAYSDPYYLKDFVGTTPKPKY